MTSRALILVGGGSSARFGSDKLAQNVAGAPLLERTIQCVEGSVDRCVIVVREDQVSTVRRIRSNFDVVAGGSTRTQSEISGLRALGPEYDLIGIHDAARPCIRAELIDTLFATADRVGGAVPVLEPAHPLFDKRTLKPIDRAVRVQTPQVFRGPELIGAYSVAERQGIEGHDTSAIMERLTSIDIAAVPGDEENVKVTYPADLEKVRSFWAEHRSSGAL